MIRKINTIGFLDDEKDYRESFIKELEANLSVKVLGTDSYEQAIHWIKEDDIDFFITDNRMPESEGIDVIKKVRNENSNIPIALLTAFTLDDDEKTILSDLNTVLLYKQEGDDNIINDIKYILPKSKFAKVDYKGKIQELISENSNLQREIELININKSHVVEKILINVSIIYFLFFSLSFIFSSFLNYNIIHPFWSKIGLAIFGALSIMAALSIRKRNKFK